MTKPIRVVIADTSFIIRKGLRMLIKENPRFEFVAEVADADSLHKILSQIETDVLVVDHCCDDCFSLSVIDSIKTTHPELKILVISHEKSTEEIRKIISVGIKNYILKDCDEHEITEAIIASARGEKYFCGQIIDILIEKQISPKYHCATGGITERELEIISLLVSGNRPKEIASKLHISPFTVNTHKKNIYKKLSINNSYELSQFAIKSGILK